jgi:hypothetical protein
MLTNPAYGGAYAYGKSEHRVEYAEGQPRKGHRRKPREQWLSLIPLAHDGYVSWDQFERIQQVIAENVRGREQAGAANAGRALLAGLLRCRRCGHKLTVRYTGSRHDVLRYSCWRGFLDNGEPRCIAFGGVPVDERVAREILHVVQPAAIEAALMASEDQALKRDEVVAALERDLEAARYSARRAQKQFDAAGPENRLVVDELERRWNRALEEVRVLELRIEDHVHRQAESGTPTREEFEGLAADLEAIWNDARTDPRLKKRIVRTLIREIVVDVDAQAGEVILVIHWKGGVHTELRLPRRRRGQNSAQTSKAILDGVRVLARLCSDDLIAGVLNRNGLLTGRGNRWTRERVTALRSHHAIPCYSAERSSREGWMNLTNAANLLGISARTLRLAVERREVPAEHPFPDGPWVFNRLDLEAPAARALVQRIRDRNGNPASPIAAQANFKFSST